MSRFADLFLGAATAAPSANGNTPSQAPRGASGRAHTDGFLEFDELNQALTHPLGTYVFDTMWRTDPDVRRTWGMCINPIIAGTWVVDPYGGEEATDADRTAAELVEWWLFQHLRGGVVSHIAEALTILRAGFAPFEQVWHATDRDGKTLLVPEYLGARVPRSVLRWLQDDREQLQAIEQLTIDKGSVLIPASDIVYYRCGVEGDNWEGTSPLRAAYKPWYIKEAVEKLDAIAQEKQAVGVPILYPPENPDVAQLDELEGLLDQWRAGEVGWLRMPGPKADSAEPGRGWLLEILGQQAQQGRDPSKTLSYHSDKIAAALVAEFMRLGQSGVGARATADVQQDPFYQAVEGFVSTVIEPPLQRLVERVVQVNLGDRDGYPRLHLSLVDSTSLSELADYAQKLTAAGALHPDEPLEDYLRDRADLPPADQEARAARLKQQENMQKAAVEQARNPAPPAVPGQDPQPQNGQPAANGKPVEKPGVPATAKPEQPAAKTAGRVFDRAPLRHWEQHVQLERIDEAISTARSRFEQAGIEQARQLARTVAAQVAAGKDPPATPPARLERDLHAVLADVYQVGHETVRAELAAQADGPARTVAITADRRQSMNAMKRRARVCARNVLAGIARAVLHASLAGHDQARLQVAGEQAAGAALRAEGQLHAAPALNAGRADEAQAQSRRIEGARYTSILDMNSCDPCTTADDSVLRALDDPVRVARMPPNQLCEGGDRCRCIEAYQLKREQPAAGG